MEIFAHARKLRKNIKNQATRSKWSKVGHMGHLVAPPGPTMALAGMALQVPPHQSMGNGQETQLQAFSTIDSKSVHDQRPKRGITWIEDPPSGMSGAQLGKWCSYPHSTTSQGDRHRRTRAHSIVGSTGALPMSPDAPQSLQLLSFRHMQRNTLGSNPMC